LGLKALLEPSALRVRKDHRAQQEQTEQQEQLVPLALPGLPE